MNRRRNSNASALHVGAGFNAHNNSFALGASPSSIRHTQGPQVATAGTDIGGVNIWKVVSVIAITLLVGVIFCTWLYLCRVLHAIEC